VRSCVRLAGVFRLPGKLSVGTSEVGWWYCLLYGHLSRCWLQRVLVLLSDLDELALDALIEETAPPCSSFRDVRNNNVLSGGRGHGRNSLAILEDGGHNEWESK
jgi:hypothetical protein